MKKKSLRWSLTRLKNFSQVFLVFSSVFFLRLRIPMIYYLATLTSTSEGKMFRKCALLKAHSSSFEGCAHRVNLFVLIMKLVLVTQLLNSSFLSPTQGDNFHSLKVHWALMKRSHQSLFWICMRQQQNYFVTYLPKLGQLICLRKKISFSLRYLSICSPINSSQKSFWQLKKAHNILKI